MTSEPDTGKGQTPPDRASQLRRRVAVSSTSGLLNPGSLALIAPFLAQGLGAEGRGELAAVTAPLALAISVATLGIPEAITYFVAKDGGLHRRSRYLMFFSLMAAGLLAVGAVITSASWIGAGNRTVTELICWASVAIVPGVALAFARGNAFARGKWRSIFLERMFAACVRVVGVVGLFATNLLSLQTATAVLAISYAIGLLAYIKFPGRLRREEVLGVPPPPVPLKAWMSYSTATWLGALSGVVLGRVDQVLMNPLAGPEQLGLYVVAVNCSEIALIFNAALREVIFPVEAQEGNLRRLAVASRVSSLITLCIATLVVGTSPWLVPLVFGKDFHGSVLPLAILAMGIVLGNPGSIAGAGLAARGRPGLRSWALLIACVVNVILVVVLVPPLGAIGAAIATLAGNVVAGTLVVAFLVRYFGAGLADFYVLRRSDLVVVGSAVKEIAARVSLGRGRSR